MARHRADALALSEKVRLLQPRMAHRCFPLKMGYQSRRDDWCELRMLRDEDAVVSLIVRGRLGQTSKTPPAQFFRIVASRGKGDGSVYPSLAVVAEILASAFSGVCWFQALKTQNCEIAVDTQLSSGNLVWRTAEMCHNAPAGSSGQVVLSNTEFRETTLADDRANSNAGTRTIGPANFPLAYRSMI